MTQYMLSVNHVGAYPELSEDEMQAAFEAVGAFNEKLTDSGRWVFGGGLEPRETATTVRLQDDKATTILTDGPYAETKEFLGGFWVVECADLDEALALAREAAVACADDVEVRPFQSE
jgi:hypothetical protein